MTAQYDAERAARLRYEEIRRTAQAHGAGDDLDPIEGLLEVYRDALAWKRVCQEMLGQLDQIRYRAGSGEQLRAEVALWERSLERVAKIGADLVRLGIDDRQAKISELQHTRLLSALEAALAEVAGELGVDPKSDVVRGVIGRHLREVSR